MKNKSFLCLIRILLLFSVIFTVFFNNTVAADARSSKNFKSSEINKPSAFPGQHINFRSVAGTLEIPDNFPLGRVSAIQVDGFVSLKNVAVEIHVDHPRIGDLMVQLECPDGQVITLFNREGGHKKNIDATYRITECDNSQVVGSWKLHLSDHAQSAQGSLLSWKLHFTEAKLQAPLFRVSGVKDWYLVGNAITLGSDSLNVRVDVSGPVGSMAASIDEGQSQPLTKSTTGFSGALNISHLPPGVHALSLTANDSQSPIAKLPFHRSHPFYMLMTTDWDSSDSVDSILHLHEKLHIEHPGLKFTHFLGPYTFTDPGVSKKRQGDLVDWLKRLHTSYEDEIGLHIHPFCNFVNTVPGVRCRFKPSDSYDKGDTSGYTVLSSAYSEGEFLKLLKAADSLFTNHGLDKPTAFRTGSWAANAGTLKALAEDGFVVDSSANNWARIEESRHEDNGVLYTWNREHWKPINDLSQPYYPNSQNPALAEKPAIDILEIPDNGSLVDYVTGAEMIKIFNLNWVGTPMHIPKTFVFGFHPVSYSLGFHKRIEKALKHFDSFLAANGEGPVVYETASRVSRVFKDMPR